MAVLEAGSYSREERSWVGRLEQVGAKGLKDEMVGAFETGFKDPERALQASNKHAVGVSKVGTFLSPSLPC